MRETLTRANGDRELVGKYASYKIFMRKYNLIASEATSLLGKRNMIETFVLENVRNSDSYTWPQQKEFFDHVLANVAMLRSLLENSLNFEEDETLNLRDFIEANLRRAVFTIPEKEVEIQNSVESLLIGRGMAKGTDYDRETGRVKTSGKESIPDFVFYNLGLCAEVKLSKSKEDLRGIVDQINADVRSYGAGYKRQLYIIYDLSSIRDEAEFKKDIESTPGVSVVVVKH